MSLLAGCSAPWHHQEYHRQQEQERQQRTRCSRVPSSCPWQEAASAVLVGEELDEWTAELLIKHLAKLGCGQLALSTFDLLAARGSPPLTKALYDAALGACCSHFMADDAMQVYGRMRTASVSPDVGTCNLVIAACSSSGRVADGLDVLSDLCAAGHTPNSFTACMLLTACGFKRKGPWKDALRVVEVMQAAGQPLLPETLDALLRVCEAAMRKAARVDEALAVFKELQRLGLANSTQVYNALLAACARHGAWREARTHFAAMEACGTRITFHSYTSLIQACVSGGHLEEALAAYEHLVAGRAAAEDDIPADIHTYNTLILACHQAGMLEKALEIMAWLSSTGLPFDTTTYEELIGTVDIARIWDQKAQRAGLGVGPNGLAPLAVFPEQLRPAPFDGMRMMYLEHLQELREEEVLAAEKLGEGSWAPRVLMAGTGTIISHHTSPRSARHAVGAGAAVPARRSVTPPTAVSLSRVPSLRGLGTADVGALAAERRDRDLCNINNGMTGDGTAPLNLEPINSQMVEGQNSGSNSGRLGYSTAVPPDQGGLGLSSAHHSGMLQPTSSAAGGISPTDRHHGASSGLASSSPSKRPPILSLTDPPGLPGSTGHNNRSDTGRLTPVGGGTSRVPAVAAAGKADNGWRSFVPSPLPAMATSSFSIADAIPLTPGMPMTPAGGLGLEFASGLSPGSGRSLPSLRPPSVPFGPLAGLRPAEPQGVA